MKNIEQIVVSKSNQRLEFFKCNPDVEESVFNKYWEHLLLYDLPELFPFTMITVIDDSLDTVRGEKIAINYKN